MPVQDARLPVVVRESCQLNEQVIYVWLLNLSTTLLVGRRAADF